MWFRSKKTTPKAGEGNAPPPWENIDDVPKSSVPPIKKFDLTEFVMHVTGYGKWTVRFLLLGLAVALVFLSYLLYLKSQQVAPLPRDVNRPAMDEKASTTVTTASTTLQ